MLLAEMLSQSRTAPASHTGAQKDLAVPMACPHPRHTRDKSPL